MRDYQRKKNNSYSLPCYLYKRMLYLIRDYDRLKAERKDILFGTPEHDGAPHSGFGSPTESKALRLYMLDTECSAVEKALNNIPECYRKGIMRNICYYEPYPLDADRTTYGKWKHKFVYFVAKNLHHIS